MLDDELSIEEKRRLVREQYGDGSDLPRTADEPRQRTKKKQTPEAVFARQQKRGRTGENFQAQLDDTHEGMIARGEGYVVRHHVPTKRVSAQKIVPVGRALCDYSGHINHRRGGVIPVVFDAKVLDEDHATYVHDSALQHQLHELKRAADNGAVAFLLVRAVERVFWLDVAPVYDDLLRGRGVTLYRKDRLPDRLVTRLGRVERLQQYDIVSLRPSVPYIPGKGWLWAKLLEDG